MPDAVDLEVRKDGGIRLFYSRASDTPSSSDEYHLMVAVVGEVAGLIEANLTVGAQASFRGSWQFGFPKRGIPSLVSYKLRHGIMRPALDSAKTPTTRWPKSTLEVDRAL